jgi:hypothetical protein
MHEFLTSWSKNTSCGDHDTRPSVTTKWFGPFSGIPFIKSSIMSQCRINRLTACHTLIKDLCECPWRQYLLSGMGEFRHIHRHIMQLCICVGFVKTGAGKFILLLWEYMDWMTSTRASWHSEGKQRLGKERERVCVCVRARVCATPFANLFSQSVSQPVSQSVSPLAKIKRMCKLSDPLTARTVCHRPVQWKLVACGHCTGGRRNKQQPTLTLTSNT